MFKLAYGFEDSFDIVAFKKLANPVCHNLYVGQERDAHYILLRLGFRPVSDTLP